MTLNQFNPNTENPAAGQQFHINGRNENTDPEMGRCLFSLIGDIEYFRFINERSFNAHFFF